MQTERQPQRDMNRVNRPHARPSRPYAEPFIQQTEQIDKITYAREASYFAGALLITLGLVGFVVNDLIGLHLTYANNWLHLITGIMAIACAYVSLRAARIFCFSAAGVYGALGILGFIMGNPGTAAIAATRDSALWILSPGMLEFGTADHIVHLVLAGVLLTAGLLPQFRRGKTPIVYH